MRQLGNTESWSNLSINGKTRSRYIASLPGKLHLHVDLARMASDLVQRIDELEKEAL
jgi:hypothetical protein